MCGACGAKGANHWSAPFLATQPARAVAARAVTAMAAGRVSVVATVGGYLVGTPTGRRTAVDDLGAVWSAVRGAVAAPVDATPLPLSSAGLLGRATMPVRRVAPIPAVLVTDEHLPPASTPGQVDVDARCSSPAELVAQLLAIAGQRPGLVRVLVSTADVDQLVPHLRAHRPVPSR